MSLTRKRTHISISGSGRSAGLRLADGWESDPLAVLCEAARLDAALQKLQGDVVRRARAGGRSWTEIGRALGTTRQAAWQRFAGGG